MLRQSGKQGLQVGQRVLARATARPPLSATSHILNSIQPRITQRNFSVSSSTGIPLLSNVFINVKQELRSLEKQEKGLEPLLQQLKAIKTLDQLITKLEVEAQDDPHLQAYMIKKIGNPALDNIFRIPANFNKLSELIPNASAVKNAIIDMLSIETLENLVRQPSYSFKEFKDPQDITAITHKLGSYHLLNEYSSIEDVLAVLKYTEFSLDEIPVCREPEWLKGKIRNNLDLIAIDKHNGIAKTYTDLDLYLMLIPVYGLPKPEQIKRLTKAINKITQKFPANSDADEFYPFHVLPKRIIDTAATLNKLLSQSFENPRVYNELLLTYVGSEKLQKLITTPQELAEALSVLDTIKPDPNYISPKTVFMDTLGLKFNALLKAADTDTRLKILILAHKNIPEKPLNFPPVSYLFSHGAINYYLKALDNQKKPTPSFTK